MHYYSRQKRKQTFCGNANTTDVTDYKTFWRLVKLFFTDKAKTRSKITLIREKEVQKEDQERQ